jgi:primosomal protein N' (replication factor Y)
MNAAPNEDMLPGLRATVADSRAKAAATRRRKAAEVEPATTDPIARVLVDLPLAHLDRPFDYLITAKDTERVRPGVRVKVRFAGQDVDGFVVERTDHTDHTGQLAPLRRVVSDEPVLAPEVVALSGSIAERYAGTRADVLRLAVPPRHATTEKAAPETEVRGEAGEPSDAWQGYAAAEAFLSHLGAGGSPRAVWTAGPGTDWPAALAEASAVTDLAGRGVLIAVPDHRDVELVSAALTERLGTHSHVTLTADKGPAARYRDFLAISRGLVRIVVGTRAAAFAPVHDLGLIAMWDDGDDLYAEPRAPYPHTREVLLTRAAQQDAALLLGGFACSVEAQHLLATGWARPIALPREQVRERVSVQLVETGEREHGARMPRAVHDGIKKALADGPVLVQTPRQGYLASLACERCRTPARCRTCQGPLTLPGPTRPPVCSWCGTEDHGWACPECGHHGLRAPVLGDTRTAEELGRAFPGTTVRTSSGDGVAAHVGAAPAIVVATPGAEPVAETGYAAVVLLDTWLPLARADLRAGEEALRRWLGAAGLVAPGGHVLAVGDPAQASLQALVRWDPVGYAEREASARAEAHLPPASRVATLQGPPGAVDDLLTLLDLPDAADVLGPVPFGDPDRTECRVVIRVPRAMGSVLSASLAEVQRLRSARKLDPVRVQVDPAGL